ncbi:MAG: glycoside hydrolase family 9 [Ruminococcus sp.]|nr:glycoside hydrolase family 9 [Ruminococcus sp.]
MHKHKRIAKAVAASVMAATMLTTTVATVVPMTVSAGQLLGEQNFDYKALPWHTCETNPGKQEFNLTDEGEFHVKVLNPGGEAAGGESRWDLQTRHRKLHLIAGHTYEVSYKVKVSRPGIQIYTKIGDIGGDNEYWHNDSTGESDFGAKWDPMTINTTDWVTHTGTFTAKTTDEAAEWAFHYGGAGAHQNTPCTQEGDEIWFDDMSLVDTKGSEGDNDPNNTFGVTRRDNSGLANNFISVNQIGYYSNLKKIATLGDNKGDITHEPSTIDLANTAYDFEVINVDTKAAAYTGKTIPGSFDADSGDTVHQIDFTDLTQPGRYYIQVGEWRSFEFNIGDNIYSDDSHDMLTNAINYYYQNRSGIDIEEKYITSGDTSTLAHKGGHAIDTASVQKEWVKSYKTAEEATGTYASSTIEASGGWYDAGDHGKYVVNGGISVWTLQNMYERAVAQDNGEKFENGSGTVVIPETNNKAPDILDECAVELDWMMKMIVKSDEPTWGKYAGFVYHKLHDHKWTGLATRPYDYAEEWGTVRIVKPPTYAATLNFVACAAQAARLWEPYDSAKAAEYLAAAKSSYAAFKANFKEYQGEGVDPLYAPLDQAIGGGAYGDNEVKDDAYWAACELYITTGDSSYYTDLCGYKDAFKVLTYIEGGENKGSFGSFNWGNTSSAGSLSLLLNSDNADLTSLTDANKTALEESLVAAADTYVAKEEEQGYGIPYVGTQYSDPVNLPADVVIDGFEWGSNSFVINNAMVMAYAYDETSDIKYMNGVATALDYIFGRNPLAFSYVTGYGSYHAQRPHHRYWSNELDSTLPMAPDGVLSGGANAGLQDPYVRALGFVPGAEGNASERCYVDSIEAWSVNEVTINWNAPFAWVVSFMQDEAAGASEDGLTVSPSNVNVAVGETDTIEVKVDGAPATGATFTSSDDSVAKVDANGTVTGVAAGSATITVTLNGVSKTVKVTVTDSSTQPTTSEDPSESEATLPTGGETVPTGSLIEGVDYLYGDVDLNGAVELADVAALAKHVVAKQLYPLGKNTPETVAQATEQANVAYDDYIDAADTLKLIEYKVKSITEDKLGPQK